MRLRQGQLEIAARPRVAFDEQVIRNRSQARARLPQLGPAFRVFVDMADQRALHAQRGTGADDALDSALGDLRAQLDGDHAFLFDAGYQALADDRGKVLPEHPAYVIYTSGSTGKPKGILINQRSICHFLRSENAVLEVTQADTVYQGFSVAFDMSFEEIWIAYLVGATLWIGPKEITGDPETLPRMLAANGGKVVIADMNEPLAKQVAEILTNKKRPAATERSDQIQMEF